MNMHQPAPSLFNTHARTLIGNGYRPIPGYQDTKRPSIKGWDNLCDRQWDATDLQNVMQGQGQREGKMVCLAVQRELVAIDIDVEDETKINFILEAAKEHLGVTPLKRIGRHPRFLLVYRSDGSIRSRKHHPIEIFSGSGQFVAFGYHAGAGRDYLWPIKSPLDIKSNDASIPLVSQHNITAFLSTVWTVIPKRDTPHSDYVEALYKGDVFTSDRETALNDINTATEALANALTGNRNEALFHVSFITGQAVAAGLIRTQEVEEGIRAAATACGLFTEDNHREVHATMRSGFEKGRNAPFFVVSQWFEAPASPETTGEAVDAATSRDLVFDDDSEFKLPPALIKGVLPKTGVAFIGGQSGAGKTFLAVDLAIALTTQQTFFGRKVKEKVGVVILAGEGAETLKLRVQVARQARGLDSPLPIAWMPDVPDLMQASSPAIVMGKLRSANEQFRQRFGVRLGVVIFDTLAATFLLENENDNSEAAKVIKVLQNLSASLGVLCVPVHHYGKGAETGLRGASAWRAGSDSVLSVTAERNQQTGLVSGHSLWLSKSRVGEEGPLGGFALRTMVVGHDEDGEEVTSCYVVPEVVRQITAEEQVNGEELVLAMLAKGGWRENAQAAEWAGNAVAEAFGLDVEDKGQLVKVKTILKRLHDEGKVRTISQLDEKRMPRKYVIPVTSDVPHLLPNLENSDMLSEGDSVFD